MEIKMYESYREYREYKLDINDGYLKAMTEWLRKHTDTPDTIPDITEKMVYNAMNSVSMEDNISFKYCYPNSHDDWSYETTLYAQIYDYITEDLWEEEYDVLDGETDETSIEIDDYDEEE